MPKAAKAQKASEPEPQPQPTPQDDRGPTTFVKDFVLSIGPITTMGKLINVRRRDKTDKFVTMCPECHTPGMQTRYACANPDHVLTLKDGSTVPVLYATNAVAKATKLDNGTFAPVAAEDVSDARKSLLPKDELALSVHPAADVDNLTWADDNAYVLLPRSQADKAYGSLVKTVKKGMFAFVGPANLRGHEGFFRLDAWQDHLVIQKCVFPQDCNQLDDPVPDADDMIVGALEGMLERVATPFDPAAVQNATRERLAALRQAVAEGKTYEAPTVSRETDTTQDLLAALEAFASKK